MKKVYLCSFIIMFVLLSCGSEKNLGYDFDFDNGPKSIYLLQSGCERSKSNDAKDPYAPPKTSELSMVLVDDELKCHISDIYINCAARVVANAEISGGFINIYYADVSEMDANCDCAKSVDFSLGYVKEGPYYLKVFFTSINKETHEWMLDKRPHYEGKIILKPNQEVRCSYPNSKYLPE